MAKPIFAFLVSITLAALLTATPAVRADMRSADEAHELWKYRDAYRDYLSEAQKGNHVAENMVGAMQLWGLGTGKNVGIAAKNFRQSANQGNPVAMSNLGWLYQEGIGVQADLATAADWYGKAARLGDERGRVMQPILTVLLKQREGSQVGSAETGIPDSILIGAPAGRCEPVVRGLLVSAESKLGEPVVFTGSPNWFFVRPGEVHEEISPGHKDPDLSTELINEYSQAGCFADAARLLDRLRQDDPARRNAARRAVITALIHAGHHDPAIALAYANGHASSRSDTNNLLPTVIRETASAGDVAMSIKFMKTLVGMEGKRFQRGFSDTLMFLAGSRDDRDYVKLASSVGSPLNLSIDTNIWLVMAHYRLGNQDQAMQALNAAETNAGKYLARDPISAPSTSIAGMQALLAPERVDRTVQDIASPNPVFRINALSRAVRLSSDHRLRLHWLAQTDKLAPLALQRYRLKAEDDFETYTLCEATLDYARVGEYRKALALLQKRGCNTRPQGESVAPENMRQIFRFAAHRNETAKILPLIPSRKSMQQKGARPSYLIYVAYGLVRAGQNARGLDYLRLLAETNGSHRWNAGVLAAIGAAANPAFPFEKWIQELLAHEKEIGISRWDSLRIMFSACVRVRGLDGATRLAATLTEDELATAQIGIVQGLRNHEPVSKSDIYPRIVEPWIP